VARLYCVVKQRKRFRDEFTQLQNGVCAICKEATVLEVDHDHKTGIMRGLLCPRHNKGLGFFSDKPELLEAAAKYLRINAEGKYRPVSGDKEAVNGLIAEVLADPRYPSDRARARELSELTGVPEGTLQTRISRARRKNKTLPQIT
jgi:hypothetical protein